MECGVIGNTRDFGSLVSGSSPDTLTNKTTRRFPWNLKQTKMKSYPTPSIEKIAKRNGADANTIARDIVNALRDADMYYDNEDVYGLKVKDAIADEVTAQSFCKVIKNALNVAELRGDEYFAALDLTIMNDYDCPECGCELEIVDSEHRLIGGNGYTEEWEYETLYEVYECPHCGHKITKEYV